MLTIPWNFSLTPREINGVGRLREEKIGQTPARRTEGIQHALPTVLARFRPK